MECPVCHESMVVIEYKSIELDYCVGCMGVWFDQGEIELLLSNAGISLPGSIRFSAQTMATREIARPCPLCKKPMQKVSPPGSDVVLDQCPDAEGIWFDAGEISQTINGIAGPHSDAIHAILREFLGEALGSQENRHD